MGSERRWCWLCFALSFVMGYALGELVLRAMGVVPWW